MARTVRRLPVGSRADTALLRESIGTPWDPILGTVAQEVEPPIVKMHGEEQIEEQEQERAKNLPA